MHLVVSFTSEESDSLQADDYWTIERQVLESIGLQDHRRVLVQPVQSEIGNLRFLVRQHPRGCQRSGRNERDQRECRSWQ